MNTIWSDFVQSTEELYQSRGLRFREDNRACWLPLLQVKDGFQVLEVGCAGGVLLHRLKRFYPGIQAVGLDRDDGHIAYARNKTRELGIAADFVVGDALCLPFEEHTFDLCYSHTVMEFMDAVAFLREQHRVLKNGGTAVVLSVRSSIGRESWLPAAGEEKALLDRAWNAVEESGADANHFTSHPMAESDYPKAFEQAGFSDIDIQFAALTRYAPDSASVSPELALRQIEAERLTATESAAKARRMCPDALSEAEWRRLSELTNARFDGRIERYRRGEKVWDIAVSAVMAVSGKKL